jgi:hypothetical protein
MSADITDTMLKRAFAAAREQHGPSADEWSSLSEYVNMLPAPSGGASGSGAAKLPWAQRLLGGARAGGVGGGLVVLGLALWGSVALLKDEQPGPRAQSAATEDVRSVDAVLGELPAVVTGVTFDDYRPSTPALAERCRPTPRRHRAVKPRGENKQPRPEVAETNLAITPPLLESAGTIEHVQPPDDGPLLRDVARLTRVEAALGQGDAARALTLLDSAPTEKLHNHARVLRALALCQQGKTEVGRKLLSSGPQTGAPQHARARAQTQCAAR